MALLGMSEKEKRGVSKKKKFTVGDRVVITQRTECYYSDRYGNPSVYAEIGEIGIVGATDVPYVRKPRGSNEDTFMCIDFHKPGVYMGDARHNNCTWRVGISPRLVQPAPPAIPPTND